MELENNETIEIDKRYFQEKREKMGSLGLVKFFVEIIAQNLIPISR
jgi:hypothetical protein